MLAPSSRHDLALALVSTRSPSSSQGYEILRLGVFNADPHPGNVLLMPDGRLGLIDYGQVGPWALCAASFFTTTASSCPLVRLISRPTRSAQVVHLSDDQRRALATLLVALGRADAPAVAAAATHMGFRTKRMEQAAPRLILPPCPPWSPKAALRQLPGPPSPDLPRSRQAVLQQLASVLFDRDVPGEGPSHVLRRLDGEDKLQARFAFAESARPARAWSPPRAVPISPHLPQVIPHEFILCARVSLLLRGMSQLMAQRRLSTATLWRTEAESALRTLEVEG